MAVSQNAAVTSLLSEPESSQLEFKVSVPRAEDLAKLMAGFANAEGGTIVVGYEELGKRVRGIDRLALERAFARAQSVLDSPVSADLTFAELGAGSLGVIRVDKAQGPVAAGGGYYIRAGDQTKLMSAGDIKTAVTVVSPPAASIEKLSEAVAKQSEVIEKIRSDLDRANSPTRKLGIAALGAFAGVLGKWLGALLLEILRSAF